jgi:hypothetical protein
MRLDTESKNGNKDFSCESFQNRDKIMSQMAAIEDMIVSCIATPRHGQLTTHVIAEAMLKARAIAPAIGEPRGHEQ